MNFVFMPEKPTYFSQYGQDKFLDQHVFKARNGGVFVDIGANDGITYSNTYFFEKTRNWSGLCIEPHPDAFAKLRERRTCKVLNEGVSAEEGQLEFIQINGYAEMLSGLKSRYEKEHIERIENEILAHGGSKQTILVSCKRLDAILKENDVNLVDYCTLDIEGGEMEVLETIDLKKQQIQVFTVENNYYKDKLKKYFEKYNYRLLTRLHCDEVYERKKPLFHFFFK